MTVLFITWDGPQTTYLEGLFLPIFARLQNLGFSFRVVQLTWGPAERIEDRATACQLAGVPYRPIRISRSAGPLGQAAAVVAGALAVRAEVRAHGLDVLMPRGPLPGAIALAARGRGTQLVYDADGLMLDERVEFGGLPQGGLRHRVLRAVEAKIARSADRVLCRTAFGASVIRERAGGALREEQVSVVGNGRDAERFRPFGDTNRTSRRKELNIPLEAPLIVYSGSLGAQYCLPQMAAFFRSVSRRRTDARMLVVTQDQAGASELRRLCAEDAQRIVEIALPANVVPEYLAAADIGLSFRVLSFSMRAVAPIKIGEYLLCGVPALTTENDAVGGTFPTVNLSNSESLEAAAEWFIDDLIGNREKWRDLARAMGVAGYSLDQTVAEYAMVFGSLATPLARYDGRQRATGRQQTAKD